MKKIIISLSALLVPTLVNAQAMSQITNAVQLKDRLLSLGDIAIYILVSLAVLFIVYSTVMYFIKGKAGDESRKEAGMQIFYGIAGLAIILSIWGLVNILTNTFATSSQAPKNRFPNTDFTDTYSSDASKAPMLDAPKDYGQCNAGAC